MGPFINIEAGINDVSDMAAISDLLMAQLTEALADAAKAGVSGKRAIDNNEWLISLVSFATLETKVKAEALRKQFNVGTESRAA